MGSGTRLLLGYIFECYHKKSTSQVHTVVGPFCNISSTGIQRVMPQTPPPSLSWRLLGPIHTTRHVSVTSRNVTVQ